MADPVEVEHTPVGTLPEQSLASMMDSAADSALGISSSAAVAESTEHHDSGEKKERTTSKSGATGVETKSEIKPRVPTGKIECTEPELRGGLIKYTAYKIIAPGVAAAEHVWRRYNDFVWLRGSLEKGFPGLFVPPLPPKKMVGNTKDSFVAERKEDLSHFLNRIAAIPYLAESQAFSLFLTRSKDFEEAVKAFDKQMSARDVQEVISMHDKLFPDVVNKTLSDKAEQEINSLKEFLTNCETRLTMLTTASASMTAHMLGAAAELSKMTGAMQALYADEKGYAERPSPARVDIMEQLTQWQLSVKQDAVSYGQDLSYVFKQELSDVQAFLELIKKRAEQAKKAQSATAKAEKWSKPGTVVQNEKQEKQKAEDIDSAKKENHLLANVTKLILFSQIQQVWTDKMAEFKSSMASFAKENAQYHQSLLQTWQQVSKVVDD